jgi:uncharacterized protein (TIGR02271 family)
MTTRKEFEFSGEHAQKDAALAHGTPEYGEASSIVIPIVHEQFQVDKRQLLKSKVKVHKTVEEHLETVNLSLQSEVIEVKRVPKDEMVREASSSRQEGDTLILPVYEEVLVVEKRLRLVEEIHITTKRTQRHEVREVLLRQEKVRLERDGKKLREEVIP